MKTIEQFMMAFAVLLNVIALMGYDECYDEWWIMPLGLALLVACGASFVASFMLQHSFLHGQGTPITGRAVWATLRSDGAVAHRFFNLLAALVALFLPNGLYLYVFHLLDLLLRSPIAMSIVKAISHNWQHLAMTAALAMLVVYCYSIIGFLFFQHFFAESEEAENECATLMQCFVTTFYKGLRQGGGIGDAMQPPVISWSFASVFRILFDISFWVLCIMILLNSFLGKIMDTFGELREADEKLQEELYARCFICGIKQEEFDRAEDRGFALHTALQHNVVNYFYFLVYLQSKEVSKLTGPEARILEQIKKQDPSFFPLQRALVLQSTDFRPGKDDGSDEEDGSE
jgi:hypothetical protein